MPKRVNKLPKKYANDPEMQKKVVKLFREGNSYRQITAITGIYGSLIRHILVSNGVTPKEITSACGRRKTVTENKILKVLIERIKTKAAYSNICDDLGISASVFYERKKVYTRNGTLDVLMEKAHAIINGEKIKNDFDPNDRRSPACKQVKTCWDSRCYLHRQCPAFAAWQNRKNKPALPRVETDRRPSLVGG